mmetsp:Transcript_87193/g.130802  ORF Transcript_87193/g.130802 Transcript_87193/m.130802 type:complete len:82 (-) Transcript_87193:68-313(-)
MVSGSGSGSKAGTVSESVASAGFNIPTSAHLTDEEVAYICQTVREVLARHCHLGANGHPTANGSANDSGKSGSAGFKLFDS